MSKAKSKKTVFEGVGCVLDKETGEIYYEPVFEPVVNFNIGGKGKLECSAPVGLIVKKSKCGRNFIGSNQISIDDMIEEEEKKGA